MDTIHHVSQTVISSISVSLNCLLLHLVLNYSSFHVPEYKYLRTVASANDIVLGLAILYGQPAILFADGYYAFVPNGFFANKSWLGDYYAGTLVGILVHVYIVCVSLQFVYRYRFMSRDSRQEKDKFALVKLLVVPFLFTSVHAIITIWMASQPPEFAQIIRHIMEVNQWPIRDDQKFNAGGGHISDLKMTLYTASYIITILGSYAIILWCEYKIMSKLKFDGNVLESTRRLHVEVHRALIAMAAGPILALLLAAASFLAITVIQATPGPITAFMVTVETLTTLANPITTICIVKSYRKAFLRMIGFGNKTQIQAIS